MRIKFKPGNTVRWEQDFSSNEGMPADIWFTILDDSGERFSHPNYIRLSAEGYGVRGDYGNGSIYIRIKNKESKHDR